MSASRTPSAEWTMDRLLDNPVVDHVANTLKTATSEVRGRGQAVRQAREPAAFPPLAPLAGNFVNPGFGKAAVRVDGDAMVLGLQGLGSQLKLEPWDGDVFTVRIVPLGQFIAMAANPGPGPSGFVQMQIDKDGKLGVLRLSFDDGQAYDFRRE